MAEAALPGAWRESRGRESRERVKEVCRAQGHHKVCQPRATAVGLRSPQREEQGSAELDYTDSDFFTPCDSRESDH